MDSSSRAPAGVKKDAKQDVRADSLDEQVTESLKSLSKYTDISLVALMERFVELDSNAVEKVKDKKDKKGEAKGKAGKEEKIKESDQFVLELNQDQVFSLIWQRISECHSGSSNFISSSEWQAVNHFYHQLWQRYNKTSLDKRPLTLAEYVLLGLLSYYRIDNGIVKKEKALALSCLNKAIPGFFLLDPFALFVRTMIKFHSPPKIEGRTSQVSYKIYDRSIYNNLKKSEEDGVSSATVERIKFILSGGCPKGESGFPEEMLKTVIHNKNYPVGILFGQLGIIYDNSPIRIDSASLGRPVECYLHAIAAGDVVACCNLGIFLLDEKGNNLPLYGIVKDEKLNKSIFNLFKAASDQQFARAQFSVGKCYCEGIGVDKNLAEGMWYIRRAIHNCYSSGNSRNASKLNKQIHKYLLGIDITPKGVDPDELFAIQYHNCFAILSMHDLKVIELRYLGNFLAVAENQYQQNPKLFCELLKADLISTEPGFRDQAQSLGSRIVSDAVMNVLEGIAKIEQGDQKGLLALLSAKPQTLPAFLNHEIAYHLIGVLDMKSEDKEGVIPDSYIREKIYLHLKAAALQNEDGESRYAARRMLFMLAHQPAAVMGVDAKRKSSSMFAPPIDDDSFYQAVNFAEFQAKVKAYQDSERTTLKDKKEEKKESYVPHPDYFFFSAQPTPPKEPLLTQLQCLIPPVELPPEGKNPNTFHIVFLTGVDKIAYQEACARKLQAENDFKSPVGNKEAQKRALDDAANDFEKSKEELMRNESEINQLTMRLNDAFKRLTLPAGTEMPHAVFLHVPENQNDVIVIEHIDERVIKQLEEYSKDILKQFMDDHDKFCSPPAAPGPERR